MELSSTLRDVRDALDRLDEALHRENVLVASAKDSISDFKAKEANLHEQIQVDVIEYAEAQQRKEDVLVMLGNSTIHQDPQQLDMQTKDEINAIRNSFVQEAESFLQECFQFGAQFSETGFTNKERQILESQQEANAKRQEAEKKKEALMQRDVNLDRQLQQWKDAFVQTLKEQKSNATNSNSVFNDYLGLQESVRNFSPSTGNLSMQNNQQNNKTDTQTIQLRQSLTEIEDEVSRLKLNLSHRQRDLQTLEAEKARLEQSIAISKAQSCPPKNQDRKKKQSGNDREINKRPRSDPTDEEASIERDLFGGIRHHLF